MKPLKKLQNKIMQLTHLCQVIIHLIKEQPFHLGCRSPFRKHPPSVDEIKEKTKLH